MLIERHFLLDIFVMLVYYFAPESLGRNAQSNILLNLLWEVMEMPILRISLWAGRTKEQKAELAKALTDTVVKVAKVPAGAVTIMFEELPKENWATEGILHSELHADK